ncbi:MAG: PIG-L family deacetylase [Elusimicrobia bacterium]|nr:PIG-L family deacetylase [Elusimicrobiota bacterium]
MLNGFGRLELASDDRLLILAPHPDDDAVACGGLIQRAVGARLPVRLVFATYGDERIFQVWRGRPFLSPSAVRRLGGIRRREAIHAACTLGLTPDDLVFLGYPDRGTLAIWLEHWGDRSPLRSSMTRADRVPYDSARSPGSPYHGERLLEDLKETIRDFRPTKIFVSHPVDDHPDHRALYNFARAALWDLEGEVAAELLLYLVHFRRWPIPRGYYPGAPLNPPERLRQAARWITLPLDENAVRLKRAATLEHRSQQQYSPGQLRSAVKRNELFGYLPAARFGAPGVFVPFLAGEIRSPGIEYASASMSGGQLRFRVRLAASLVLVGGVSLRVYGHRRGERFASMPKVHVRAGRLRRQARSLERPLDRSVLTVRRRGRDVELSVPLEVLGRPDRFLVAAQATAWGSELGHETWRTLE